MNSCPRCQESFSYWPEYQEHLAFACKPEAVKPKLMEVPVMIIVDLEAPVGVQERSQHYSSGRLDLKPLEWRGYMAKDKKAELVGIGEGRMGRSYFYGH